MELQVIVRNASLLIFLLAFSNVTFAQSSQNQIDPEKRQLIVRLMDVMGVKNNLPVLKNKIFTLLGASRTPEERAIINRVSEKFDASKIIDAYIPIYDRHYSKEDLKGLISYYESPLGRKVAKEAPAIAQEGLLAGAEMGREAGREVEAEIAAEKAAKDSASRPN